ncbi:MAG: hypothetical protein COA58_16325 [Bacteroidetes bacterium]|nr:MAG: hypothetical protein COA58_16325 [Bacteroidota bacterium]
MDPKFYKEYYTLERSHWWFKARLVILESVLKNIILKKYNNRIKVLNVGVATGATTEMLMKYSDVTSLEYDKDCCDFLKEKTGIQAVNASLTDLPFKDNEFDLICAFDVIEHIENDSLAIAEINRVLKPKAYYFITVPAFQFLWSNHDVINHHFRRYTKSGINDLFESHKFTIDYSTYFNFWLFFPIALVRFLLNLIPKKSKEITSGSDNEGLNSSGIINSILFRIFRSEKILINRKIKFPVGVSILSIGQKVN